MITQTGSYALRTLAYLVDHPATWVLGREVADHTGIPTNYLSKILNQLRRAGFVESRKGWGGGFQLSSRAPRRPIASVLALFEGRRDVSACVFEIRPCDENHPCPLHDRWTRVRREYEAMLKLVRVGDLGHPNGRQPKRRRP